jgi:LacI family transcriptional regulator
MGRTAAHLLDRILHGMRLLDTRILVPPAGINVLASSRHEPAKHPHVMRARHFIRQYACQGIKTDQVANYVGVSRSSLESYFRQELGYSVHDEILRSRLNAATAMLTQGSCNLAEVALKCGFTSSQYMHLVFKRELGCSPRGYQQRLRNKRDAASAESDQPTRMHDARDYYESRPCSPRRPAVLAA